MAKQVKLTAEPRSGIGRSAVRKLKTAGAIPAVIYGSKVKPEALQVSKRDINAMLSHAAGENILVEIEMAGVANRLALVQEVQHAPVSGDVLHVDFHAVSMDEVIEADVPIEPTGVANGVKNFGGLLEQSLRALVDRMSAARFAGCDHGGRFRFEYWRRDSRARDPVASWGDGEDAA